MADVAVCDAMVGNVTMKFFEGLAGFIFDLWRSEFKRPPLGPFGYLFMRPAVGRIRQLFDYEKMGASPLLGVKGMVLITHGSAKRRMIGVRARRWSDCRKGSHTRPDRRCPPRPRAVRARSVDGVHTMDGRVSGRPTRTRPADR